VIRPNTAVQAKAGMLPVKESWDDYKELRCSDTEHDVARMQGIPSLFKEHRPNWARIA
jgi:hypothetical protein